MDPSFGEATSIPIVDRPVHESLCVGKVSHWRCMKMKMEKDGDQSSEVCVGHDDGGDVFKTLASSQYRGCQGFDLSSSSTTISNSRTKNHELMHSLTYGSDSTDSWYNPVSRNDNVFKTTSLGGRTFVDRNRQDVVPHKIDQY